MSKTTTAAYVASGTSMVIAGLTLQDWTLIVGIICTVTTCAVNWYFKRKKTQHEVELNQLLKAQINQKCTN